MAQRLDWTSIMTYECAFSLCLNPFATYVKEILSPTTKNTHIYIYDMIFFWFPNTQSLNLIILLFNSIETKIIAQNTRIAYSISILMLGKVSLNMFLIENMYWTILLHFIEQCQLTTVTIIKVQSRFYVLFFRKKMVTIKLFATSPWWYKRKWPM